MFVSCLFCCQIFVNKQVLFFKGDPGQTGMTMCKYFYLHSQALAFGGDSVNI